MSIVESDGPPSWSLDVSETGESTKCLWVGVMGLKARIPLIVLCRRSNMNAPTQLVTLHHVILECFFKDVTRLHI